MDESDLDQLTTIIINEIYDRIQEHFILILDDFHLVNEDESILFFINRFLTLVDENCHLIVTSRTILNLHTIQLVAHDQMRGFGMRELAFTPEELQEMALRSYRLTVSKVAAKRIIGETGGWPLGVALSIRTSWSDKTSHLRLLPEIDLHDYLADQVFAQQAVDVQDFLLRTSLLEEFDVQLCEAVLGSGDWWRYIGLVSLNILFVLPVDDGVLRYHHLFRDFLHRRIQSERPVEWKNILQQLARVYAERGMWEKAHDIYIDRLHDVEATADLIQQAGIPLIENGRLRMLSKWIDNLPENVSNSRCGSTTLKRDE